MRIDQFRHGPKSTAFLRFGQDGLVNVGDGAVSRTTLRHNPTNAVTQTVERLTDAADRTVIRKVLRHPTGSDGVWAASNDPRHWNYWRREVEVYRDEDLRTQLLGAGLILPDAEVEAHADGAALYLEDISGLPGTSFELSDHTALALACGRWQAVPAPDRPWTSKGFLRTYSGTRSVPWHLLDDDEAWRLPLVADNWPVGLRAGWLRLVAHRDQLLDLMERLPRARCHLDLWVSNAIRRPSGEVALLDWAFTGDGALGEDIGNHIPDAVFDLFWPAEQLPELADACITAYLDGLRSACWRGDPDLVVLAVMASCVKYTWLLPLMLGRASDPEQRAYHEQVDAQKLFHQRGLAFAMLVLWCDQAIKRLNPSI
jgi:hypothetical protein